MIKSNLLSIKKNSYISQTDDNFIEQIEPFLGFLYHFYFRCEVEGWENIPDENALYVCNHNGFLTFEALMIFYAWWKKFGLTRKARALAHEIVFSNILFNWIIPKLGGIPARPDLAHYALQEGYSLLVFPGGEKEAFRPFLERKQIHFFQRKGFIRLALAAKVPIVPVVSIGAHDSFVILNRGEKISELLGLNKRFRLHGFPITIGSLFSAWCLTTGACSGAPLLLLPVALANMVIPFPVKMKFKILPPVYPTSLFDPKLPEIQNHQNIYDYTVSQMQSALIEQYKLRPIPFIGKFKSPFFNNLSKKIIDFLL